LHRAVDLFGRKIGVVSGKREFTYAEFGDRAERLADGLAREGVRTGERVAFLRFNTNQLLEG
jgi:fatty-acyl-CoA synthase